jgi:hypothetical protein
MHLEGLLTKQAMFHVSEGIIIALFPLLWKTLQYPMFIIQ